MNGGLDPEPYDAVAALRRKRNSLIEDLADARIRDEYVGMMYIKVISMTLQLLEANNRLTPEEMGQVRELTCLLYPKKKWYQFWK